MMVPVSKRNNDGVVSRYSAVIERVNAQHRLLKINSI